MLNFMTAAKRLSLLELEELASAISGLLVEQKEADEEAQEDLKALPGSLSALEVGEPGIAKVVAQYFTDDFINQYRSDEDVTLAVEVSSSGHISKKIGSLEMIIDFGLTLSGETEKLTLKGLSRDQCRLLLRDYFKISDRQRRSGLCVLETILTQNNETFTLVTLSLGKAGIWKVGLCFRDSMGLQFSFDDTAKGNVQRKQESLVSTLRDFIEEEYGSLKSAFKIQLSIDSQAIELVTKWAGKEQDTSIDEEDMHEITSAATAPAIYSYSVPEDSNCCYSAVLVALMHGFFTEEIAENSATTSALTQTNGLFDKMQTLISQKYTVSRSTTGGATFEFVGSIKARFQQLFALPNSYQVLEQVMVPALRSVIADYALTATVETRSALCVRCFEGREEIHQQKFIQYFEQLRNTRSDQHVWGGPADLAVIMSMYQIRITDEANDPLELTEWEGRWPHFIMHHLQGQSHFEVRLTEGSQLNTAVEEFCSQVKVAWDELQEKQISGDHMVAKEFIARPMEGRKTSGHVSPGPSEQRSSDSSNRQGRVVSKDFYVKATVDEHTAGLQLAVSTTRPDTYLGRRQGAHITAYIVFVTAILEAVDEQSIHEIPYLLLAVAKKFVSEEHWEKLDERMSEMLKNSPKHFDRDYRKALTADLRQKSVDEEVVQSLKKSMKIHHAILLANLIDDLSNQVLIGVNQNEDVLYLRPGKINASALGAEGARIKAAMQGLRAIQAVIRWQEKNAEEKIHLLEKFKQSTQRHGLRPFLSLAPHTRISDRAIEKFFTTFNQEKIAIAPTVTNRGRTSKSRSAFFKDPLLVEQKIEGVACSTLKIISNLIFELFDLDYYGYTTSLLLIKLYQEANEKYSNEKIDKVTYKNVVLAIEALEEVEAEITLRSLHLLAKLSLPISPSTEEQNTEINELLIVGTQIQEIGIDIKEALKNVNKTASRNASKNICQHFEFVTQQAFPGIETLPNACQQYIYQEFIRNVQKKMHWENFLEENFTINHVKESFAKLGYHS